MWQFHEIVGHYLHPRIPGIIKNFREMAGVFFKKLQITEMWRFHEDFGHKVVRLA